MRQVTNPKKFVTFCNRICNFFVTSLTYCISLFYLSFHSLVTKLQKNSTFLKGERESENGAHKKPDTSGGTVGENSVMIERICSEQGCNSAEK
jgi:hypothetical protein